MGRIGKTTRVENRGETTRGERTRGETSWGRNVLLPFWAGLKSQRVIENNFCKYMYMMYGYLDNEMSEE